MPASEADIVNQALTFLGADSRIDSLDEGSTNSIRASKIFYDLRDRLLRAHRWDFATTRVKLPRMVNTPVFEFQYAYQMPSDWMRTVSIHDNSAGVESSFIYKQEVVTKSDNAKQSAILTSVSDIWMRYVFKQTDVTKWTSDFSWCMAEYMAGYLAIPVQSSNTLNREYLVLAEKHLAEARSADSQQSSPERRPVGSWVRSRGGRPSDSFGRLL